MTAATILVVDDSEIVLAVCRAALQEVGYRVLTQSKAHGSLAQVIWERPALVLLDVNMPDVDSDVLARMCTKIAQTTGTTVVLHSSLPEPELRTLVTTTGAHGFIRKTDNRSVLLQEVRAFLDARTDPSSSGRIEVVEPSRGAPSSGSGGRAAKATDGRSVLLIDRDMAALSQMREIVRDLGHRTDFALSARQAAEKLRALPAPEVVVVSADMPDEGLDLVWRSAMVVDTAWATRFVVTTSSRASTTVPTGFQGSVILKPVTPELLSRAIKRALA